MKSNGDLNGKLKRLSRKEDMSEIPRKVGRASYMPVDAMIRKWAFLVCAPVGTEVLGDQQLSQGRHAER